MKSELANMKKELADDLEVLREACAEAQEKYVAVQKLVAELRDIPRSVLSKISVTPLGKRFVLDVAIFLREISKTGHEELLDEYGEFLDDVIAFEEKFAQSPLDSVH